MIIGLPVLYQTGEEVYDQVEIKKPSAKVLSDTKDAIHTTNKFIAMRSFVAGCTLRIIGRDRELTDPIQIKRSYDKMSNKNLEYAAQEIMILYYNGEDYVEGLYLCPRCGFKVIAEKKTIDDIEIDTRDRMSDLKVTFMESTEDLIFDVELSKPVEIESEIQFTVIQSVTMGFPTTENMVKAHSSVGDTNDMKLQLSIYAYSIVKVNGQDVKDSWRKSFGIKLFNSIEEVEEDINNKISKRINKYGIDPRIEKHCENCGKDWQPFINTLNFFASALQ